MRWHVNVTIQMCVWGGRDREWKESEKRGENTIETKREEIRRKNKTKNG